MSRRVPRLALLALALLAVAGCGRKAAPVAPERRVPQPAAELTGLVRDGTIVVSWQNPNRRVDGTPLRDLAFVRVYRAEDGGAGEPRPALLARGQVPGYTDIATVRLAEPGPAVVQGDRMSLADRQGLAYGRRYTYVLVTADSLGRLSPPSRRLSVTFIAPPQAPRQLRAESGERSARLAWEPPQTLVDGTPAAAGALAYDVLRAPDAEAPLVAVTRTPIGETRYTDRNLENDRAYHYAVRAVRTEGGTAAIGSPSARVAVTPRDMTAPSPPRNLVALPSEGTVRLAWDASPEPDVEAYVVYRADARGVFVRIGSTRPPTTVFLDREAPRGTQRYAVTAEDSAARPNESARSNEVSVTVP